MLNAKVIERLGATNLDSETLLHVFNELVKHSIAKGHQGTAMPVFYIEAGDTLNEGEWIAELVFVVRRVIGDSGPITGKEPESEG